MRTPRLVMFGVLAIAGLVTGLWLGSALGSEAASPTPSTATPTITPMTEPTVDSSGTVPPQEEPTTTKALAGASTTAPEPGAPPTMLLWASGGLSPQFGRVVAEAGGLGRTTVVRGEQRPMITVTDADGTLIERHEDGWRIPLDVIAVEPEAYATFADSSAAAAIAALGPGEGLLTETSARVRGLVVAEAAPFPAIGFLDGTIITVVGVIDDVSGAGAELIVDRSTGADLGVLVDRFVLAELVGDRSSVETDIRSALDTPSLVRIRVTGETPYLRHGDAVQPQAIIKARFGEFAFRPGSGRSIEIEPGWIDDHIDTAEVPILGSVRCHRELIPVVERAMASLVDDGLRHVVDPTRFSGCFNPRRIGQGSSLSRHAWGVALDLNIGSNPRGSFSTQDPALVAAMGDVGLGWGGEWLVPDPGHYEWLVDVD